MLLKELLPENLEHEALISSFSYKSAKFGDLREFAELLLNALLKHQEKVRKLCAFGTAFTMDGIFYILAQHLSYNTKTGIRHAKSP
jgi:hypothetical protein